MHVRDIKRHRLAGVIYVEVNYVQSFVIDNLSPNIDGCSCNIALYFVYDHVFKEYFAI